MAEAKPTKQRPEWNNDISSPILLRPLPKMKDRFHNVRRFPLYPGTPTKAKYPWPLRKPTRPAKQPVADTRGQRRRMKMVQRKRKQRADKTMKTGQPEQQIDIADQENENINEDLNRRPQAAAMETTNTLAYTGAVREHEGMGSPLLLGNSSRPVHYQHRDENGNEIAADTDNEPKKQTEIESDKTDTSTKDAATADEQPHPQLQPQNPWNVPIVVQALSHDPSTSSVNKGQSREAHLLLLDSEINRFKGTINRAWHELGSSLPQHPMSDLGAGDGNVLADADALDKYRKELETEQYKEHARQVSFVKQAENRVDDVERRIAGLLRRWKAKQEERVRNMSEKSVQTERVKVKEMASTSTLETESQADVIGFDAMDGGNMELGAEIEIENAATATGSEYFNLSEIERHLQLLERDTTDICDRWGLLSESVPAQAYKDEHDEEKENSGIRIVVKKDGERDSSGSSSRKTRSRNFVTTKTALASTSSTKGTKGKGNPKARVDEWRAGRGDGIVTLTYNEDDEEGEGEDSDRLKISQRQRTPGKPKAVTLSPNLIAVIEENKRRFEEYLGIQQVFNFKSNFTHHAHPTAVFTSNVARASEIIADDVLDDIIDDCVEEVEEAYESYMAHMLGTA